MIRPMDAENYSYMEDNKTEVSALTATYLKTLTQYDVLSKEEEQKLFKKYAKTHDKDIYNKIFLHNQKLVVSVAKNYIKGRRTLEFMDLVQEGFIGLDIAIRKYDYSLDNKFSTYAVWWIRQTILRYISNNDEMVRIPVHTQDKYIKATKMLANLEADLKRPLTEEEARKITDKVFKGTPEINDDTYKYYQELYSLKNCISLNTPVSNEEGDTENEVGDFVPYEGNDADDECIEEIKRVDIRKALDDSPLNDREKWVIRHRLGFETGRTETLDELGQKLGLTKERIRQIEARAFWKLRHNQDIKKLRDYLKC